MKTTQDFVDFCNKHKIICKANKKTIGLFLSRILLQNAGYKKFPLNPYTSYEIYLELHQASLKNNIKSENINYLSADNQDIMNFVVLYGSKDLKKFLQNNGYHIIEVPRQRKFKDSAVIKQSLTDTIKMTR